MLYPDPDPNPDPDPDPNPDPDPDPDPNTCRSLFADDFMIYSESSVIKPDLI